MHGNNSKKGADVINDLLEDCLMAFPVSSLIISFYKQYQQRGFLTKKQLQGLHGKASSVPDINQGKLATLQAIINKMPNRFKSEKPEAEPLFEKDTLAGTMISAILEKYPEHKRVLFFKARYENNEVFSAGEMEELKRFYKLLK